MFHEIWNFASQQTDKDFEKDQALALILKHLFPRNPKLAKEFLAQQSSGDERHSKPDRVGAILAPNARLSWPLS